MTRKGTIYLPAWMDILSLIEDRQTRQNLAIKSDVTSSHGIKIVHELIKLKFVEGEKKVGATIPIKLTPIGNKLKEQILKIKKELLEVQD